MSSHNCITSNLTKATPKNGPNGLLIGFHDLTFTDFSSKKYPLIAKSFCETNVRKPSSPYHDFQCRKCFKAFPCRSGLNLHAETHIGETYCHICRCDLGTRLKFTAHQAKHRYTHLLSSVQDTDASKEDDSHGIRSLIELRKASKMSEDSLLKEKEIFLSMLQLQHRKVQENISIAEKRDSEENDRETSEFDCPSYFIHAKPNQLSVSLSENDQLEESTSYSSQSFSNFPQNDTNSLITGQSVADPSSFLALASHANSLVQSLGPSRCIPARNEKENTQRADFNSIIDYCYDLKSFMFPFSLNQTMKNHENSAIAN